MPLTVRLDDTLAAALERHCAATGTTKSLVVQESLAAYLLAQPASEAPRGSPSRNFLAFQNAGLIGTISGDGQSATKAVVRQRMAERLRRPRNG